MKLVAFYQVVENKLWRHIKVKKTKEGKILKRKELLRENYESGLQKLGNTSQTKKHLFQSLFLVSHRCKTLQKTLFCSDAISELLNLSSYRKFLQDLVINEIKYELLTLAEVAPLKFFYGFQHCLKVFKLLRCLKDCRKLIFRNTNFLALILLHYSYYCHIGETNHFFMCTLVFFLLRYLFRTVLVNLVLTGYKT